MTTAIRDMDVNSRFVHNLDKLKERRDTYPYRCYLKPFPEMSLSGPELQDSRPSGYFMVIPLGDLTCWGFDSREDLTSFLVSKPEGWTNRVYEYLADGTFIEDLIK